MNGHGYSIAPFDPMHDHIAEVLKSEIPASLKVVEVLRIMARRLIDQAASRN